MQLSETVNGITVKCETYPQDDTRLGIESFNAAGTKISGGTIFGSCPWDLSELQKVATGVRTILESVGF